MRAHWTKAWLPFPRAPRRGTVSFNKTSCQSLELLGHELRSFCLFLWSFMAKSGFVLGGWGGSLGPLWNWVLLRKCKLLAVICSLENRPRGQGKGPLPTSWCYEHCFSQWEEVEVPKEEEVAFQVPLTWFGVSSAIGSLSDLEQAPCLL